MGGCLALGTLARPARCVAQDPPVVPTPEPGSSAPGAEPGLQDPAPVPELEPAPYTTRGSLGLRLRSRSTPDESDQDLYAALVLDGGDPDRDAWTWRVDAQAVADLDGASGSQSSFYSLADARGGGVQVYLYEAYAERHDSAEFSSLRLGRQSDWETPVVVAFDGARAVTRPSGKARAELGGYAGAAVRQYSEDSGGDPLFGLWGSWHPWRGGRARLDWLHVEDDERIGTQKNDLLQLALGQSVGEKLHLDGSWSRLEGEDRDLRLRGTWSDAERDFLVAASWVRLFQTQGTLAGELDPFSSTLLAQFPYWEGRVTASKGFGSRWRLAAGAETRRLVNEGDAGPFNHEYDRVWGTATIARLPLELEFALTGEQWDSDGDAIDSWGAELSRKFASGAVVSAGTAYALYKLDLFQAEERTDVRTWYARWREAITAGWSWDLGYEYEDDPGQDLQTLRLGGTWAF